MVKRNSIKAIIFLLILFQGIHAIAQDLFDLNIIEKTSDKIVVSLSINPGYQPYNYSYDCDNRYTWDFGDGSTESIWKDWTDDYSGTTHEYILTGNETSFSKTVSLHIIENQLISSTYGEECVYASEYYEEEFINEDLGTDLSVEFITNPTGNYKINENIKFYGIITANSSQNTDNLYYTIMQNSGPQISGETPVTAPINISDFGATKNLNYNVTPTTAGVYYFNFIIMRGQTLVYEEQIILNVSVNGGTNPPLGDHCGPAGTFYLDIDYEYQFEYERYKIKFQPKSNSALLENSTHNYIGLSYTRYGPYDPSWGTQTIVYNAADSIQLQSAPQAIEHYVPMSLYDKEIKVRYIYQNWSYTNNEFCPPTVEEIIMLPKPQVNPQTDNSIEVPAEGVESMEIRTHASGCYAYEVVDPNNPVADGSSWLNIDVANTNLEHITIHPDPNSTENTRKMEIRIYDPGMRAESGILTDMQGKQHYYRSVLITQSSMLEDVDYENTTLIPIPYLNTNVGQTAYYGLFGTSDDPMFYVSGNPDNNLPLDLLIDNVTSGGNFYIYSYDEHGDLLGSKKLTYYNSSCLSYFNYPEFYYSTYDIYIANVNNSMLGFHDIIPSNKSLTLFAKNEIRFTSGFHAEQGSNFYAKLRGCAIPKSAGVEEQNETVIYEENNDTLHFAGKKDLFQMLLYPNPANSLLTLGFIGDISKINLIQIYNNMGQLVWVLSENISGRNEIDISSLMYGVYYVRVVLLDDHAFSAKFIKK